MKSVNELALHEFVVERVPLVAILVEQLSEWCTEEDEKEPPVPRRQVDEQI